MAQEPEAEREPEVLNEKRVRTRRHSPPADQRAFATESSFVGCDVVGSARRSSRLSSRPAPLGAFGWSVGSSGRAATFSHHSAEYFAVTVNP